MSLNGSIFTESSGNLATTSSSPPSAFTLLRRDRNPIMGGIGSKVSRWARAGEDIHTVRMRGGLLNRLLDSVCRLIALSEGLEKAPDHLRVEVRAG